VTTGLTVTIIFIAGALAVSIAGWFAERFGKGDAAKSLTATLAMIRGYVLNLILKAEQDFGGGTGVFKKAQVIEVILNSAFFLALPAGVRSLVTYEALSGIIDAVCATVFNKQKESNVAVKVLLGTDSSDGKDGG